MKRQANNIVLELTKEQADLFKKLESYLKLNGETMEQALYLCVRDSLKIVGEISD